MLIITCLMIQTLSSSNTLFSGLTDQDLKSIEKGEEVWFEAGDKILAEGEHDTFYALLDGNVEVIMRDGSKEAVLSPMNQETILESFQLFLDGQIINVLLCYEEKPSIKMG